MAHYSCRRKACRPSQSGALCVRTDLQTQSVFLFPMRPHQGSRKAGEVWAGLWGLGLHSALGH